jgi:hypothetical protein
MDLLCVGGGLYSQQLPQLGTGPIGSPNHDGVVAVDPVFVLFLPGSIFLVCQMVVMLSDVVSNGQRQWKSRPTYLELSGG